MNPFEKTGWRRLHVDLDGTFIGHISKQIENTKLHDSIRIDRAGRDFITTRSTLRVAAERKGFKFTTKAGEDGEIWALRIK